MSSRMESAVAKPVPSIKSAVVSKEESNGISARKTKGVVLSNDQSILWCQYVLIIYIRQFPINLSKRNAFVDI